MPVVIYQGIVVWCLCNWWSATQIVLLMEDDQKFSNTTGTFWFGDITSRTRIKCRFPYFS